MRFEVIDRISIPSPAAAVNEDAAGATGNAAWVIDGATGISDLPPLVPGRTDAAWLVAQLNARLHNALENAVVDPYYALAKIDTDIGTAFSNANDGHERPTGKYPTSVWIPSEVVCSQLDASINAARKPIELSVSPFDPL